MPNYLQKIIAIGFFMCFYLILSLDDTHAATLSASSCSQSDVAAAYSSASPGDTILVPPGQCTWTSTLTIAQPVTILGNGGTTYTPSASSSCAAAGTTCLQTTSSLTTGLFQVNLSTTSLVRISGFYFELVASFNGSANNNYGINVSGTITQLRVDHNFFHNGKYALNTDGRIFGVYDHNYFYNDDASMQLNGGTAAQANQSWSDPIVAGMAMGLNTLYIEDNTFVRDENWIQQTNNHIESGHGGRFVIRNNTFDGSRYCAGIAGINGTCTAANFTYYPIMTHGNGAYYTGTDGLRGHPIVEVYNNTIRGYRIDDAIYFRGGSNLAYNNTVTNQVMSTNVLTLREEESTASCSPSLSPCRSDTDTAASPPAGWPAQDQIFNSFFWNNTFCTGYPCTGVPITSPNILGSNFIKVNRDFFMAAPAASGGSESFTGRAGASMTVPTCSSCSVGNNPSNDTMTFSSSGANAYYPYTAFSYPHPLVSGGGNTTSPPAPTGLRVQ